MRNRLPWVGISIVLLGITFFVSSGTYEAEAQTGGASKNKSLDKALHKSLREVINRGATIFNENRDANGCYQLYRGSLLTAQPLLSHRPELQKKIKRGLANAESQASLSQRAFALNKLLQEVRGALEAERLPLPKPKDKKREEKKKPDTKKKLDKKKDDKKKSDTKKRDKKKREPKKVDDKKPEPKKDGKPAKFGQVSGKILYKGAPVTNATITFADTRKASTVVEPDGTYSFKKLPVGRYAVFFEKVVKGAIPVRYTNPATSGLSAVVKEGENQINLELK